MNKTGRSGGLFYCLEKAMVAKVRGIRESKAGLAKIINDVKGRKIVRGIRESLMLIGTEAAVMTPIDTSNLINSQYQDVNLIGTKVVGTIGYSAEYAAYVHDASGKLKGKPRSSVAAFQTGEGRTAFASNQGNFWDPHGEPQFLTKAVKKTRKQRAEIMRKELKV